MHSLDLDKGQIQEIVSHALLELYQITLEYICSVGEKKEG
jgi:hypothetical protein